MVFIQESDANVAVDANDDDAYDGEIYLFTLPFADLLNQCMIR